jgi:exocyst complex component 4
LVETTLEEVGERAEYSKRGSIFAGSSSVRSEGICIIDQTTGIVNGVSIQGALLNPSSLRLAALESSAKQADHEILNDFFWTIFSKLDAVSQGLRVVYEVSNRIGTVSCGRR